MTQLIGAICDNREKVIMLSDRMVTTADGTLGFEHDEPKGKIISSNAMVLLAGTTHEPELIEDAKAEIKDKEKNKNHSRKFIKTLSKNKREAYN